MMIFGRLDKFLNTGLRLTIGHVLVILLLCSFDLRAQQKALGAIPKDVLEDYRRFLAGRNPIDISDYSGPYSRRDVIEVVLIYQALILGGYEAEIGFLPVESYGRQLLEIKQGRAAFPFTSVWASDADSSSDQVYLSKLLVKPEEFIAGFYVRPDNVQALEANNFSKLVQLSAVSNPDWSRDWNLLKSFMPEGQLFKSVLWTSMVKMVHYGRVDFLLAPFQSTRDLSLHFEGIRLVPIPGIKISFGEGRQIIFSKSHPEGKKLFSAFNIGLKKLKRKDLLEKAYTQSGFFNTHVKDWEMLSLNL